MVTISSTSQLRRLLSLNTLFNDYLLLFNDLESTGALHQLLMISLASVNLIRVHWSHWSTSTWWLACYDMCLISFSWDSVIYCTLTWVRAQLSQLGFLSVVNLSVDYGLHSVNLDSLIKSNDLLRNSNCFSFMLVAWHCNVISHSLCEYTELLLIL